MCNFLNPIITPPLFHPHFSVIVLFSDIFKVAQHLTSC